jgi:hypothetical protein
VACSFTSPMTHMLNADTIRLSEQPAMSKRSGAGLCHAFTRVDLAAVIVMLGVLAAMLVPVLGSGASKADALLCQGNMKRLILGWHLYASDNQERLVMLLQGGDAQFGAAAANRRNAPWALGWLDWSSSADNTNILLLTSDRYSKLAKYLDNSPKVFKCPSDKYLSAPQRARRWTERTRSVAAGVGIGDGNAESGPFDPIYKHVRKMPELLFPSPAETLVYLDEHPDSINDPAFLYPRRTAWVDQPASYHDAAGSIAFADGHTEVHRWEASLTQTRAMAVRFSSTVNAVVRPGDADLHWVSYRCSRRSEVSY